MAVNTSLQMKISACFLICFSLLNLISGQRYYAVSYYVSDSSIISGISILDNGQKTNSKICKVIQNGDTTVYSAEEIKEYMLTNGEVYIAENIPGANPTEKVFLKRITDGEISLFSYLDENGRSFFISKNDSELEYLPKFDSNKSSFRNRLNNLTQDFPEIARQSHRVDFNESSMREYISAYNEKTARNIPHRKLGISAGFEQFSLVQPNGQNTEIQELGYDKSKSFVVELRMELPFYKSDFSLVSGMNVSEHAFTSSSFFITSFSANIVSLKTFALLKYSLPTKIIRPYLIGGLNLVSNLKNDFYAQETYMGYTFDLDLIQPEKTLQMAQSYGGGFEIDTYGKLSFYCEFRYTTPFGIPEIKSPKTPGYAVLIGIYF